MGETLEHIPDPASLLSLVRRQLNDNGWFDIIVPNDFNPFQLVLLIILRSSRGVGAPPPQSTISILGHLYSLVEPMRIRSRAQRSHLSLDVFLLR